MNALLHIPPTRIGPGQNVVFFFWNACAHSGTCAMRIKNLQVRDSSETILELPAHGIKQVSLSVGHDEPAMLIRGLGTFTVRRNSTETEPCPPSQGPINGFMTLENVNLRTRRSSRVCKLGATRETNMLDRRRDLLRLRVDLVGILPPIWREILIPGGYSFWDLHVAIQDSMGWWDCHLHEFCIPDPVGRENLRSLR